MSKEKSKPVVDAPSRSTVPVNTRSLQITVGQDDSNTSGSARSFSKDNVPSTSRSFAEKRKTIGYIQSLSPEKRNKKDTLNYSSLTLQTAEGTKEALCFSRSRRKLLKERFDNKTAVEIYNYAMSNDGKIFINDMTQVSNAQPGDYFFQFKETADELSFRSLDYIIKETKSMDMVNFPAKVVSKGPTETAKNLKLARCVVADSPSSFMTLVLWQENIDQVRVGQVYTFQQIRVREKDEGMVLNTSVDSVITPKEDDKLLGLKITDEQICNFITTKSVSVNMVHSIEQCLFFKQCPNVNCNKKIMQQTSSFMVRCDHCNHRFRSLDCGQNIILNFVVRDPADKSLIHLTVFRPILEMLIESVEDLSVDQICEEVLKLKNLVITFNEKMVVTQIEQNQ